MALSTRTFAAGLDGGALVASVHQRRPLDAATPIKQRFCGAALVLVMSSFAADSADTLKLPSSYRNWYHVNSMVVDKDSPIFPDLGGMHNIYINAIGEPALKKGGSYPDETVFLSDLHEFIISEGSYLEGKRKLTAIMRKDKKKYASTGGWGFQAWAEGDPNRPLVTDPVKHHPAPRSH